MSSLSSLKTLAKLEEIKNGEKYFQTLEGHVKDALKILREYIQKNHETISQFCGRWDIDEERFLRNLFLTIYLHDLGKLTKEFQENIRQNKRSQRYPHAYYGFFLLHDSFTDTIIDVPIELAAILGHHTQLYDQIYLDYDQFDKPTFLENEIIEFLSNATKIYKELELDEFFKFEGFDLKLPDNYQKINPREIEKVRNQFVGKINRYLRKNKNHEKVRSVFTYFFSILQTCDDYSSANFSKYIEKYNGERRLFDSILESPEDYVLLLRINDPLEAVLQGKTPYEFQKKMLNPSKFVTLFAPCGRGKTEAALLWAINSLKKFRKNKIVFAMPTQTTSNAMYDRLKAIFGEENVGLYHGRSFIKLSDEKARLKEEYDEEKDGKEIMEDTFKGNIFFKPITITTVDHLIYSFVKGFSQADFALGNLQNAVIVFDEVHYYEKLTLEHLITLFERMKKMDIPHLLMSGTLPDFLLNQLEGYEHIVDRNGLKNKPFKLEYSDEKLIWRNENAWKINEGVLNEITENYKKGRTQFVILNTVERAKQFYLKLKEKLVESNLMLYHSQFIYSDRVKKENEIYQRIKKKPFILVATQVIEISLDISCDIMYSELAPPDAIGQRAGRLNRNGKSWKNENEHKLKIFSPENHLPYEEEFLKKDIISNYQKSLSYQEIKEFCDVVYENYRLEVPSNLREYFKDATIFGKQWKYVAAEDEEGLKFKVRDKKIQHVDVIPECIFKKKGEEALNIKNLAKIPLYYLLNDMRQELGVFYTQEDQKGRPYWICRYPYTYEIGFNYGAKISDFNIFLEPEQGNHFTEDVQ